MFKSKKNVEVSNVTKVSEKDVALSRVMQYLDEFESVAKDEAKEYDIINDKLDMILIKLNALQNLSVSDHKDASVNLNSVINDVLVSLNALLAMTNELIAMMPDGINKIKAIDLIPQITSNTTKLANIQAQLNAES